ncbi:MAG: LPS export ABC transporter permease LptG [Pseudomonadota bacterium]
MSILNRYIYREFIRLFILVLFVFISIYLLVDFFEKIDNFLETGLPYRVIGAYFIYKIPLIVKQMEPVAVLIGGALTIGLLARNNELLAMKSLGRNLFLICRPIFLSAFVFSGLLFVMQESLIPAMTSNTNFIWNVQVKRKQPKGFFGKDRFWFRGANAVYSINSFDAGRGKLQGVEIVILEKDFSPKSILYAREGRWIGGKWLFRNGWHKVLQPGGSYRMFPFHEKSMALSEGPEDFREMTKSTDEMTSNELSAYARKLEGQGQAARSCHIDLQARFAYILMGPVLLLLGIPAFISRNIKSSMAVGISLGMLIAFVIWITWDFSLTLGRTGVLPPWAAAWSPLIAASGFGAAGWRIIWQ